LTVSSPSTLLRGRVPDRHDDGPDTYRLTDDEREQLQLDRDAEQDAEDLDREARRLP
jgi:hypothetical protein